MRVVLMMLSLLMSVSVAQAQAPGDPDRTAIRTVIERQLDAFRRGDGGEAYSYASSGIRTMFGNPDNFMAMVRQGYPQVYRPRDVSFQDLVTEEGRLTQRVLLVGPDGVPSIARYFMQRQPDGSWLIDGCVIEQAPELAA